MLIIINNKIFLVEPWLYALKLSLTNIDQIWKTHIVNNKNCFFLHYLVKNVKIEEIKYRNLLYIHTICSFNRLTKKFRGEDRERKRKKKGRQEFCLLLLQIHWFLLADFVYTIIHIHTHTLLLYKGHTIFWEYYKIYLWYVCNIYYVIITLSGVSIEFTIQLGSNKPNLIVPIYLIKMMPTVNLGNDHGLIIITDNTLCRSYFFLYIHLNHDNTKESFIIVINWI